MRAEHDGDIEGILAPMSAAISHEIVGLADAPIHGLEAVRQRYRDLLAELPPQPPKRLEFTCSCGTILVATPATYDKHSRCAMCQTVMLLNLVYDAELRSHEIVPFRISPDASR